jgi:hypothetical protein
MKKCLNLFYLFGFYLLLFLALFGISSCGLTKRTKTKITTVTQIKIDTVIKIIPDTVTFFQYSTIADTAKIDNKNVSARSYFSVTKQKIVLELKLKPFYYPLQINKTVTEKKQIKEVKGMTFFDKLFSLLVLTILIILLIYGFKIFKK